MPQDSLPSDTIALVTGASSGIGADIARDIARRGAAEVWLVARRRDRLEALASELGDCAKVCAADLSVPQDVDRLINEVPRVDLLVNNAGFGAMVPFLEQVERDRDRLTSMVDVNCRAIVRLTAAWLPGMTSRRRGWILNVGSIAGMFPTPTSAVYGASKAFVNSYTEALRIELRHTGVRVHLLAPGPVSTEFFDGVDEVLAPRTPLLWRPSPEVAQAAVDGLLRDRARTTPGFLVWLISSLTASIPNGLRRLLMQLAMKHRLSS